MSFVQRYKVAASTEMTNGHNTANVCINGCWFNYDGLNQKEVVENVKEINLRNIQHMYLVQIGDK